MLKRKITSDLNSNTIPGSDRKEGISFDKVSPLNYSQVAGFTPPLHQNGEGAGGEASPASKPDNPLVSIIFRIVSY